MNGHAKLLSLIFSVLCLPAAAFAQGLAPEGQASGAERRKGWVVAAYVGGAHTASSSLRVSQPALGTDLTFEGVRLRSRSFDPPLYYGLRGGYFLPRAPSLGFEAEFIHLKVFSDPGQRVRVTGLRRLKALEALRRSHLPFDETIVLLNYIVQVLHAPQLAVLRHDSPLL